MKVGEVKTKALVKSGPEIKVKPQILGIDTVSVSANAGLGIESSYSKTSLSVGEKTEDKTNLITGNNEKLITSPISINDKKISIEEFGYLTLKAEVEILNQAKKLGLDLENFKELKYELTLFDGKLKFRNYEFDLGKDYTNEPVHNPEAIFGKLTKPFIFTSGAGGWYTEMSISKDGSIKGTYQDMNRGSTGSNHPNGQMDLSKFTGKFKNLVKVNDYEYKMTLTGLDYPKAGETKIVNGVKIDTTEPYGIADAKSPGKEFILYLPGRPVKDLPQAVGSWIYDFKNRMPEKLTSAVIFNKEKKWAFVESDYPISKVPVDDELAIKEIIDKSKPVMEADSLYVRQFNPGELIDYYNTYKGDKTYQLEDVIKALHAPAKKVSVPLKDYTEEQWRELANDKKSSIEWFYSQADKAFYQVAKIGLGGAQPPLIIESSDKWKVSDNGIEVKTYFNDGVNTPYQKYLLKKNNKKYDGGINKTPYYISSVTRL